MKLYNCHSSSTSHRVRIGLELKGLTYDYNSVRPAWDQCDREVAEYRILNPQGNFPILVDGETRIAQSVAILEYLEEQHPLPPLLPQDPAGRAWVRSLALHIACEIQPLRSLRVERFMTLGRGEDVQAYWAWLGHWFASGFDGVEAMLAERTRTGTYCYGDTPTLADCFLVPEVLDALHPVIGLDISQWPNIDRVYAACAEHRAFRRAHPERQPDSANLFWQQSPNVTGTLGNEYSWSHRRNSG